ncbi:MAG: hypothetical protein ABUL60_27170 [Myxococcales bacterium]
MTHGRAGVFGFAASLAGLFLLACGSTASSGPEATGGAHQQASGGSGAGASGASSASGAASGGANGSGGASRGGAGAGGSSAGVGGFTLGDSKTEACIAYVLAVCGRQDECSGSTGGDCLRVSNACPDLVFSAGATRTVATLQACAQAYQKLPCEQIELGTLPDCVTPGTVALGAPCVFSSQCASLSCGGGSGCGTCVPSSHEGESCANGELCMGLLVCNGDKCARRSSAPSGLALGQPCSDVAGMYCQSGLRCDAASSKCAEYPTLGMPCADTHSCGGGKSYCDIDTLICKAFPGEGMPCGFDGVTGEAGYCLEPLSCDRPGNAAGVCKKRPSVGQPCLLDPSTSLPALVACDAAARCDATQSPPLCAAKVSQGQHCSAYADCVAGTRCICSSGEASCDGTSTVCGRVQLKGQPCTAVGDVCHPGFTCTAGVCEPRDSQGLFAAACGP